nr:PREDICTED: uncharacterized protein LOC109039040 [Bemisia tabaci]XP_018909914.1 PREDICTED: uncharacterized protein LOC109039040 [Bemisia tabaci]
MLKHFFQIPVHSTGANLTVYMTEKATFFGHPAICKKQPSICKKQPSICKKQLSICKKQPSICKKQLSICSSHLSRIKSFTVDLAFRGWKDPEKSTFADVTNDETRDLCVIGWLKWT